MQIRTVVVDDEQPARNELCFQLEQLDNVEIIGQACDGIQAVELIESLKPDLALLDVQMPGLTGFEVARELLGRNIRARIVFVTAYDQYAIEAFEINAVDYLLKPVEPGRLSQMLTRVSCLLEAEEQEGSSSKTLQAYDLERIVKLIAKQNSRSDPIVVKVGKRLIIVQSDEIVFASLSDDIITVATGNLSGSSNYRTLDELQSQLDPAVFWRVHRSHLVNINKIKEIVPWFSRNYILKMADQNGTEIPVSRAQTKRMREHLSL